MKKVKDYYLVLLVFGILFLAIFANYFIEKNNVSDTKLKKVNVLPTLLDEVKDDSMWGAAFQLVWNDFKSTLKTDVVFIDDKENTYVSNLNMGTFDSTTISDGYYYKKFGLKSAQLKEEIENASISRFNRKIGAFNNLEFDEEKADEYLLYSMLVRKLDFYYPFDIFTDSTFGIDDKSDANLYQNIKILFYLSDEEYAVELNTKIGDKIVLYKGYDEQNKSNFKEIYNEVVEKENTYDGETLFTTNDKIIISDLNFIDEREFKKLEDKKFYVEGIQYSISRAISLIELKIDNLGGVSRDTKGSALIKSKIDNGRNFNFRSDYVLFLKEEKIEVPYLAITIDNISNYS